MASKGGEVAGRRRLRGVGGERHRWMPHVASGQRQTGRCSEPGPRRLPSQGWTAGGLRCVGAASTVHLQTHSAFSSPNFLEFPSPLLFPLDSSPQIIKAGALGLTKIWEQQSLELGAWNVNRPATTPHSPLPRHPGACHSWRGLQMTSQGPTSVLFEHKQRCRVPRAQRTREGGTQPA